MTIYKKIPQGIIDEIILIFIDGKSKENISDLTGLSENKVSEILDNLNSSEYSNLFAYHLVVNFHKDGQDVQELVELIQITDMLTQQGVMAKEALELATDITEFCHSTNLGPDILVINFKRYCKVAPNDVKTFKDLQRKIAKALNGRIFLKQEEKVLREQYELLKAGYNRKNGLSDK